MAEATPRINASYLESFANRNVRLVGKVTQLRGDTATVDAGGPVTVILNRVSPASPFACTYKNGTHSLYFVNHRRARGLCRLIEQFNEGQQRLRGMMRSVMRTEFLLI